MEEKKEKIDEVCKKEDKPVTIEAIPYRGSNLDEYTTELKKTGITELATFMNICDNPVGKVHTAPISIAHLIKNSLGITPIVHITCKNSTLSSIQRRFLGLDALGINNLLIVSGDGPIGDYRNEYTPSYMNSINLIKGIKDHLNQGKLIPDYSNRRYVKENTNQIDDKIENFEIENNTDFTVGGVIIPERKGELEYAKNKIECGVDFFQTQIVYDKYHICSFIEDLDAEVKNCPPILLGVRPISSYEEIKFIADNIPQVKVPESQLKEIRNTEDVKEFSADMILEIINFVYDNIERNTSGVELGIHIIPGNNYEITKKIIEEIN